MTVNALLVVLHMLVGAVVALTLRLLLEDKITLLLSRFLSGLAPKRSRRVIGLWYSVFWYHGVDGMLHRQTHVLSLRSVGSRVTATTVVGPHVNYQLNARLHSSSYMTGTWENATSDNLYHGACQFIVQPEGELLVGRWVGWNKGQVVGSGPWALVRITRDIGKHAMLEVRAHVTRERRDVVWDSHLEKQIERIIELQASREAFVTWCQAREAGPDLARPAEGAGCVAER